MSLSNQDYDCLDINVAVELDFEEEVQETVDTEIANEIMDIEKIEMELENDDALIAKEEINEKTTKEISSIEKDTDDVELENHIKSPLSSGRNSFVSEAAPAPMSIEEQADTDSRSIYVGNVDYSVNVYSLENLFKSCGPVKRITIPVNKLMGSCPKGYAYVEFADHEAVDISMSLDQSEFAGRTITIMPKRTNVAGISTTNRRPRGRGLSRGGFGARGGFPRGGGGFRGYGRGGYQVPYQPRGGFYGKAPRRGGYSGYNKFNPY